MKEERRLAGAVGADERVAHAGVDRQAEAVERQDPAVVLVAKVLGEQDRRG
jgi:hypothetical protein